MGLFVAPAGPSKRSWRPSSPMRGGSLSESLSLWDSPLTGMCRMTQRELWSRHLQFPQASLKCPTATRHSGNGRRPRRWHSLDENSGPLNEHSIDVRRSVGRQLLWRNGPSYEGHIMSWQSQDCLLQLVMAQGCQLLACNQQDGVLACGGEGEGGGVRIIQNESPLFASDHVCRKNGALTW
jgi:hypothetical protein